MQPVILGERYPAPVLVTAAGFALAALLAVGVIVADPFLMLGGIVGIAGVLFFLVKPVETLLAAIVLRVFVDILWWIPFQVGGLNLSQIFSGGVFAMLAVIVALRAKALRDHPSAGWALAMIAMLTIATVRAIELSADVDILVRYYTTPLILLATGLVFDTGALRRRMVWIITVAAAVPTLYSLYEVAAGASGFVLAGYTRVLGGYQNIHNHALVMNVFALLFLGAAMAAPRGWMRTALWGLFGATLVNTYFTYTRTGMIGVGVGILAVLVALRRYNLIGLALLGATALALFDPDTQDRFSDLIKVFDPEVEGVDRRALGSGRWGLWSWSMAEYLARPVADVLLGIGLGGHRITTLDWSRSFHRVGLTLDPHNDYLLFLYQMGPLGVLAYLGMLWSVFRSSLLLLRHGEDLWARMYGASVIGLAMAVLVTNAVSNSFIHRSAPGWYFWTLGGLAVGEAIAVRRRLQAEAREQRRPRLVEEAETARPDV